MLGLLWILLSPFPLHEIELIRTFDQSSLTSPHQFIDQSESVFSFEIPAELSTQEVEVIHVSLPPLPKLKNLRVPVSLNHLVLKYIKFFQGRGRYTYAKWYSRMGKYEQIITPILDKYNLPRELIFQAMIESGFTNNAVSSASAVGLWQFVRRTGDSYNLRYDGWVDHRRDFVHATEAAAQHMRDLYQRFNSYHLALAAYNAGVGSVSRAMTAANSNDLFLIHQRGYLQGAGGIYVPKILAAMIIAQDPSLYGFQHIKKEEPLQFTVVEVPGGLELGMYARYAKVSRDELEALNPSLKRGYVPPDAGGYPLRIPIRAQQRLRKVLKSLELKQPQLFYEHKVRFGENVADIAYAYYVSRRVIKQINELSSNQLEVGSVLLVPRNTRKPPREILNNTLLIAIDPKLEFKYANRQLVYFPIRRATLVEQIASFFNVRPSEVSIWNSLDPDARLQRGMAVRLYIAENFDLSSALLAHTDQVQMIDPNKKNDLDKLSYAQRRKERRIKQIKHKVRSGQTLKRIARRYRVSVKNIRAENNLRRHSSIYAGLILKIPASSTPAPRGRAARSHIKREGKIHRVRNGDTLWKISKRYGVSMDKLRRVNRLRGRVRLSIGQKVRIPSR
jgi:membrane-bound lytic murein transglycosylase D